MDVPGLPNKGYITWQTLQLPAHVCVWDFIPLCETEKMWIVMFQLLSAVWWVQYVSVGSCQALRTGFPSLTSEFSSSSFFPVRWLGGPRGGRCGGWWRLGLEGAVRWRDFLGSLGLVWQHDPCSQLILTHSLSLHLYTYWVTGTLKFTSYTKV